MITFYYRNKQYNIPASCDELSGKQLMNISLVLTGGGDPDLSAIKALQILLDMSRLRFGLLQADAKERMLPHINWLFAKNTLTEQLIPKYKGLYGPTSGFDNLTMGEWNACEIFYHEMVDASAEEDHQATGKEQGEDAINKLVAVLYRKRKRHYDTKLNSDGDVRVPFNTNEITYHEKEIARWPLKVKLAIIIWFDGCREAIKEMYDLFDRPSAGGQNEPGMFEVIRGLCGDRYGTFKEVEKTNVHLVMRELEVMKREAEEIERQMKKI